MKDITSVTIVLSAGHSDDEGRFDHGRIVNSFSEFDISRYYYCKIVEKLEEYKIHVKVLPTLNPPGIKKSNRIDFIDKGTFVLSLGVGTMEKPKTANISKVYHGPRCGKIAKLLAEELAIWGKNTNYDHISGGAKDSDLDLIRANGVHIEPFALNGSNVPYYVARLDALSQAISVCLVAYLQNND